MNFSYAICLTHLILYNMIILVITADMYYSLVFANLRVHFPFHGN
jgi:hypothetical protein